MYAYHGWYIRVDVTHQTAETVPLAEGVLRQYLGGVGLGAWVLLQEWPEVFSEKSWPAVSGPIREAVQRWPSVQQALHPEAPLVCAFSPLIGSPLTTSARCALVACSPLTGRLNDALCGSQWALTGKRTGFDAIVVRGSCTEPAVVLLDEGQLEIVPAKRWWGLSTSEAESALQAEFGPDWAFLVIGPAGERLVRFATVSHARRHAGRGGLGAVLGAKRIKAIGVRGNRRVCFAQPQALAQYARWLSQISLGPATAKYRELGTVVNLEVFARLGVLPERNFSPPANSTAAPSPAGASAAGEDVIPLAEKLGQLRLPIRQGCVACTIGCEHLYQAQQPVRLEYETLFALGPMCGIQDASAVLQAARLCDEFGLDTISTGGTLAWAMACAERGIFPATDLRFGNAEALLSWIGRIAYRQGLGDLLAEGSRLAAAALGRDAEYWALHVKGLELPGYDVRQLPHLALGLAVNARGADHNRSSAYDADFSASGQQDRSPVAWAKRVIECEDQAALLDSLILCKFLRHAIGDWYTEAARMLRLLVGWDVSAEELRLTAKRIVEAKKRFNLRVGWTSAEDVLPEALWQRASFAGTLGVGSADGVGTSAGDAPANRTSQAPESDWPAAWDRQTLIEARQEYYRLRGWDETGRPPAVS